jgi:hypothetical protein
MKLASGLGNFRKRKVVQVGLDGGLGLAMGTQRLKRLRSQLPHQRIHKLRNSSGRVEEINPAAVDCGALPSRVTD